MSTPRNPLNDRHQATFRLPGDLLERLDHESEIRVLGRSKLVEHLLRDALTRLPAPLLGDTGVDDGTH